MGKFDWRTLLGGLSKAVPTYMEGRASRRAAADLEAGQNEINQRQQEADAAIGDQLGAMEKSGPEQIQRESLANYAAAISRSRLEPNVNASMPANLGGAKFKSDVAGAQQQGNRELRRTADLTARIDAPGYQRQREGQRAARTNADVRELGRQGDTAAFLAKLRASRRRPSPWVTLLANLGGRIAGGYEGSGRPTIDPDEVRDFPTIPTDRRNA